MGAEYLYKICFISLVNSRSPAFRSTKEPKFTAFRMAEAKAIDIAKIGKNLVKSVSTGENVSLESLWKDQTVVITFLRRFG